MENKTINLQSSPARHWQVHWNNDQPLIQEFLDSGKVDVSNMTDAQVMLIKELDRRLIQLWHKVKHEGEAK